MARLFVCTLGHSQMLFRATGAMCLSSHIRVPWFLCVGPIWASIVPLSLVSSDCLEESLYSHCPDPLSLLPESLCPSTHVGIG